MDRIYVGSLCSEGDSNNKFDFLAGLPTQQKLSKRSLERPELYQQTEIKQLDVHGSLGPRNEQNAKHVQTSAESLKILVARPGPRWKRSGEGHEVLIDQRTEW